MNKSEIDRQLQFIIDFLSTAEDEYTDIDNYIVECSISISYAKQTINTLNSYTKDLETNLLIEIIRYRYVTVTALQIQERLSELHIIASKIKKQDYTLHLACNMIASAFNLDVFNNS